VVGRPRYYRRLLWRQPRAAAGGGSRCASRGLIIV